MDFNFIPYKLNADISDFKGKIDYISSDNGVDLYRIDKGHIEPLLGFKVAQVNLYFLEGSLITIYIHLEENPENMKLVSTTLEKSITSPGKALKLDFGNGYVWKAKSSTFALIQDIGKGRLYLYHSLKRFDVL